MTGKQHTVSFCFFFCLELFLFGAPFFGWASLTPVLLKEGYFNVECSSQSVNSSLETTKDNSSIINEKCGEYTITSSAEAALKLVFTMASCSAFLALVTCGYLTDRCSPRCVRAMGSAMFVLSGFCWILSSKDIPWLLFPAAVLLNISSIYFYVPLFKVANDVFKGHKALALSLMCGAYDSSAVIFLIFKLLYDRGFTMLQLFATYTIAGGVWTSLSTILVIPDHYIYSKNREKEQDTLLSADESAQQKESHRSCPNVKWLSYMISPVFAYQTVFMCILTLRLNTFIGNLHSALSFGYEANPSTVDQYIDVFGMVQMCGFLFSPLIGPLLDGFKKSPSSLEKLNERQPTDGSTQLTKEYNVQYRKQHGCIIGVIITNATFVALSVASIVPILQFQWVAFVGITALRAFMYSVHFLIFAEAFPSSHYAKLSTCSMVIASMFSLIQYGLYDVTDRCWDGNPFWLNIIFLILGILFFYYPWYLRKYFAKRKLLQREPPAGLVRSGNVIGSPV